MYLDVHNPKLARYSAETLAKFRLGRDFEHSFKSTFPEGIDISAKLRSKISQYPILTAQHLAQPGEVALFEAGFVHDDVLVLADVVHKKEDGSVIIYEVKNGKDVSETFKNDVAIQHYVISNALKEIVPNDLFCTGFTINHFYVLHNNGEDGFAKEDMLERSILQAPTVAENVTRFKGVLKHEEPSILMGDQCNTPYECPYQHYCRGRIKLPSAFGQSK